MMTIRPVAAMRGLTLIELIITTSIIAIMLSIGLPSLTQFLQKSKIESSSIELFSILAMARNNAITSGKDTYVCELINNNQCNTNRPFGAIWNNGWLAFQDNNKNNDLDNEDTILRIYKNRAQVGVIFNQQGRLRFRNDGSARSAGFYICNEISSKHILILYSGRARIRTLQDPKIIEQCRANILQN